MMTRSQLITTASDVADMVLDNRPSQRARTTEHIVGAALPTIANAVLHEVRRLCIRSMTPAQIGEVCDQIETDLRRPAHG